MSSCLSKAYQRIWFLRVPGFLSTRKTAHEVCTKELILYVRRNRLKSFYVRMNESQCENLKIHQRSCVVVPHSVTLLHFDQSTLVDAQNTISKENWRLFYFCTLKNESNEHSHVENVLLAITSLYLCSWIVECKTNLDCLPGGVCHAHGPEDQHCGRTHKFALRCTLFRFMAICSWENVAFSHRLFACLHYEWSMICHTSTAFRTEWDMQDVGVASLRGSKCWSE